MSKIGTRNLIGMILLVLVLFFIHILYNWAVAYWLFKLSGGVHELPSGWKEIGGINYAWTTPLYVPGCLLFALGQKLHGLRSAAQPYGIFGFLLLILASFVSSWSLASVVFAAISRNKQLLGRRYYRLILAIAGWVWIYLPIKLTWVYQWTVVY